MRRCGQHPEPRESHSKIYHHYGHRSARIDDKLANPTPNSQRPAEHRSALFYNQFVPANILLTMMKNIF